MARDGGAFVFLEHVVVVCGELLVHEADCLGELSDKLGGSTAIHGVGWNNCIWWQNRVIQYFCAIVYLHPVANNTIFANLYIIANFKCTYYAILININIVSDSHLSILQPPLLFHEARPNDAFLPNNGKSSNRNSCKIASQDSPCLNNCFTLDHNFLRSFNQNLSRYFVSLRCDKKPIFIIIQGVLFDHHYCYYYYYFKL